MKKSVIMMLALTALLGCSKMESVQGVDESGNPVGEVPVKLTGVINPIESRVIYDAGAPTAALPLSIFRVNMTTTTSPFASVWTKLTSNGSMAASTGVITMSPTQYWNNNVSIKSRFIALAPADGTFSQTGGTVTWTTALNGYTDVMCSIPVEGDKTASATAGISMQLKHLLTLIQVNVVAKSGEGAGPADFFGQVTGIELVNKKTGFVVTLPATTATITGGATPTAPLATAAATGTPANLPLIRTKTGDAITNVTIPSTGTATFGYALIAPVLAAGQISLLVKTASNTAGSTVNTASQIFAAGNSYTITLEFSAATGGVTVKDVSAGSDIAGWGPGSVSGGNVAVTQ